MVKFIFENRYQIDGGRGHYFVYISVGQWFGYLKINRVFLMFRIINGIVCYENETLLPQRSFHVIGIIGLDLGRITSNFCSQSHIFKVNPKIMIR